MVSTRRLLIIMCVGLIGYYTYDMFLNIVIADKRIKTKLAASKRTPSLSRHTVTGLRHKISIMEYKKRRYNLMKLLIDSYHSDKSCDYHVVILLANEVKMMTNDIPYPFHQNTDFLYLTGLDLPNAIAVLEYKKTSSQSRSYINANSVKFLTFLEPINNNTKLWDGLGTTLKEAIVYYEVNEAFYIDSLLSVLKERYKNSSLCLWYNETNSTNIRNQKLLLELTSKESFTKYLVMSIGYNIEILRLIKSWNEYNVMLKVSKIISNSFLVVMKKARANISAIHLLSLFEYECKKQGVQHMSFSPVITGGRHTSTVLHTTQDKNYIFKNGELILLDGGCEFNGYSTDVTRTWPVNGTFSAAQKQLYEIVLNIQKECLQKCTSGVSLDDLYQHMLFSLGHKLKHLGIIKYDVDGEDLKKAAIRFCPHYIGHYIGMDLHDTPLLHNGLNLQVGVSFTIEPGIYIPYENDIPKEYHGINIRIEDDIIMTDKGPYVLTKDIPKEIEDLERLLKN